jgi:hypothetical protein
MALGHTAGVRLGLRNGPSGDVAAPADREATVVTRANRLRCALHAEQVGHALGAEAPVLPADIEHLAVVTTDFAHHAAPAAAVAGAHPTVAGDVSSGHRTRIPDCPNLP